MKRSSGLLLADDDEAVVGDWRRGGEFSSPVKKLLTRFNQLMFLFCLCSEVKCKSKKKKRKEKWNIFRGVGFLR